MGLFLVVRSRAGRAWLLTRPLASHATVQHALEKRACAPAEVFGTDICFVSDLSQSVHRVKVGSVLTPAIRSAQYYSHSRGAFLTPKDVALSHGWPCAGVPGSAGYVDLLPFARESQTDSVNKRLMGGGMHLASVAAVLTFILSHIARREVLVDVPRKLGGSLSSGATAAPGLWGTGGGAQEAADAPTSGAAAETEGQDSLASTG